MKKLNIGGLKIDTYIKPVSNLLQQIGHYYIRKPYAGLALDSPFCRFPWPWNGARQTASKVEVKRAANRSNEATIRPTEAPIFNRADEAPTNDSEIPIPPGVIEAKILNCWDDETTKPGKMLRSTLKKLKRMVIRSTIIKRIPTVNPRPNIAVPGLRGKSATLRELLFIILGSHLSNHCNGRLINISKREKTPMTKPANASNAEYGLLGKNGSANARQKPLTVARDKYCWETQTK